MGFYDRYEALRHRDHFLVLVEGTPSAPLQAFVEAVRRRLSWAPRETTFRPDSYGNPGLSTAQDGPYGPPFPVVDILPAHDSLSAEGENPALFPDHSPERTAALFRSASLLVVWSPGPHMEDHVRRAAVWKVPVVVLPQARAEGAVLLGEAAVCLTRGDDAFLSALIRLFRQDRDLGRTVAAAQHRRLFPLPQPCTPQSLLYLVDGPFASSYSLALINREAARALEARHPGRVAVDFVSRPTDHCEPDPRDTALSPDMQELARRARLALPVETVLWNSYPPFVSGRPGALSVLHSYGWEETGYPTAFLERFARCLDGVTVMSRAVRKILIDNGLPLPIRVTGLGVDHVLRATPVAYPEDLGRSFRFLYVSSAFPRKGVDVLLEAYGRAFTGADDVSLVLKTFPNPHNRVHELVEAFRARHPHPPHVHIIDRDLPDGMMKDLYGRCHAFVAPTRGEGFGLPLAEAMLHDLPVIVTEGSGQADFCTDHTAWLIPARYAESRSHLSQPGSLWLEPDVGALARTMRAVFEAPWHERQARCRAARCLVETHFTWQAWAQRTEEAVASFRHPHPWRHRRLPVLWVSTWGGRCGIARYSQYLLEPLLGPCGPVDPILAAPVWDHPLRPDPPFVHRCWTGPDVAEALAQTARHHGAAVAVIQYHPAFFSVDRLAAAVRTLKACGLVVWITFHAVRTVAEPLRAHAPDLAQADRLAVHTVDDVNFFKDLGLDAVTVLWPHGVPTAPVLPAQAAKVQLGLGGRRVLTTFGFLMPHKGLLQLLKAFVTLLGPFPDLFLVAATAQYPREDSQRHAQEVRQAVERLGLDRRVLFLTDFLEESAAVALLQASDLIVYPYQHTEESSSAAVRFGIASGRPVACTPLKIFDDVAAVVHRLPGTDPEALAQGLAELLGDQHRRHSLQEAQERWTAHHAWPAVADRFQRVLRALLLNADPPVFPCFSSTA